jgi:site-specific recombinase XerD
MSKPKPSKWVDADRTLAMSPAGAYLASIGPGSRRTIQQAFTKLAELVAGTGADPIKVRWEHLRRPDTVRIRIELKGAYAPATANKMLSALRGMLRAARDLGLMKEADFQAAASLEQIKPSKPQPARPVTRELVASLFNACTTDGTAAGVRDAAMLAIFLSSGMRRAEAAALDAGDYDSSKGSLHIRGERPEYDRVVKLPHSARRVLASWLAIRSSEQGPLLTPVDKNGLIKFRRMTDQAVYDIFGRIVERAGAKDITLRDLRSAYVVGLIRSGKTVEEVQYLVGHASWFTTATYRTLAADTAAAYYDVDDLPCGNIAEGVTSRRLRGR